MTYCRLLISVLTVILQTDVVKTVENVLKERNAYGATFYEIGEHSPVADIRRGVAAFNAAGADAIVSVGGGSPIDAAKVILHFVREARGGGPYLRQIAIPTTLSAAEYTVSARARRPVHSTLCADAPRVRIRRPLRGTRTRRGARSA